MDFPRPRQTFRQHNFQTAFGSFSFFFFSGRLLACLAELNASHCDWYSAVSFWLKSSTKAEYFSVCFGPEFWKSLHDWLLWTLITRASYATQWRHLCICSLINNRHWPITARALSQLLYKNEIFLSLLVFSIHVPFGSNHLWFLLFKRCKLDPHVALLSSRVGQNMLGVVIHCEDKLKLASVKWRLVCQRHVKW